MKEVRRIDLHLRLVLTILSSGLLLIMRIPAGAVYMIAGLALPTAWLRESERKVRHRELGTNLKEDLSAVSDCQRHIIRR